MLVKKSKTINIWGWREYIITMFETKKEKLRF
jgi:hypothetical protein